MREMNLRPDHDYYVDEAGRLVFTAQYHLARGYCCGNGCRHCPYQGKGPRSICSTFDWETQRDVQIDQ